LPAPDNKHMDDFDLLHRTEQHRAQEGVRSEARHEGLHALHQSVGNAAIARLLQREAADEELEEESGETVQAKHETGEVQRAAAPEVGLAGGPVSSELAGRIDSQRGGGSPLDDGVRRMMEPALGTSLSDVKVHVGSESDSLNNAITAKAFTTGSDVFVRSDQWSPGSSNTQRLLAHELTHVAQQRSGFETGAGGMTVGAAETHEEHEADAVADAVIAQHETPGGKAGELENDE
jgi:hypothetical protein